MFFLKGKTRIPKPTSSTCDRKYIATHYNWNCSYICFNCQLLQNLLGLLLFMTFYVELRPFANHAAIGHVPKSRWLFATKLHALACKHRANAPGKVTLPFLYLKPTQPCFTGSKRGLQICNAWRAKSSSLLNEDPPRVLEPQFNNCVPNDYFFLQCLYFVFSDRNLIRGWINQLLSWGCCRWPRPWNFWHCWLVQRFAQSSGAGGGDAIWCNDSMTSKHVECDL